VIDVEAAQPMPRSRLILLGCFAGTHQIAQRFGTRVEIRHGQPREIYFRSRCYIAEGVYGPWLKGGDWWNESIWGNEQWDLVGNTKDNGLLVCRLSYDFILKDWRVAGLYD
jgi:protein ImuB